MQIAAHAIADHATVGATRTSRLGDRLLGLSLMAILPALFWTTVLAITAPALGFTLSASALAGFGLSVALFLACVCCALTARSA